MVKVIHDFNLDLDHFKIPNKTAAILNQSGFQLVDVRNADLNDFKETKIYFGNRIKTEHLKEYPSLQFIQLGCMGYDNLDLNILKSNGIILSNGINIVEKAISEMVLTAILYFMKSIHLNDFNSIEHGRKKLNSNYIKLKPLNQCSALVFGTGNVGRKIINLLSWNGIKCTGVNTSGKGNIAQSEIISLKEGESRLSNFDFIINALPLNATTYGLFDKKYFSNFNKNSIYINIGRKQTTNTYDLIKWLRDYDGSGAYLDVYDDSILNQIQEQKKSIRRKILLTPHVSGWTTEYWELLEKLVLNNFYSFLENQPQLILNRIC